ncbi:patched domain-containing protein 3 [Brienomyrus brachyistius]|uniref:patched domain-containing protein 3 n=1 Tax=Brienomyrus brachyistius TaxID=42636 RepID=UPI0020B28DEF|nr:patched domain-containing protein 3 [Brienomyrus brachyistius]
MGGNILAKQFRYYGSVRISALYVIQVRALCEEDRELILRTMERCRTDCIEKPLSRLFMKVGRFVSSYPIWFFIIPMLISAGLGAGFYFLKEANDIEDQFTPVNGPAKQERSFIKDNFPYNMSMFSSQRLYTEGTFASLIITLTNKENILTKEAFEEIIALNKQIQEISVNDGGKTSTFLNLCARAYGQCDPNAIFKIINNNASNIVNTKIKFPQHNANGQIFFLGTTVGGVNVDASGFLQSAQAIRLYYYLEEDTETQAKATLWLEAFLSFSANLSVQNTTISHFTSLSRQQEMDRNTDDVIPLFSITYFLAITFSITSCMRLDNVRNKVWVASFGVISAGMAVLSSFGMLLYIGVPFSMTVSNAPFLILGIGVDDMFIMIASWQQTNVQDDVRDRMAHTYKEAAISITITTLTDVLAFYIGTMTGFRSVQSFCLYTGTAILFCYFYNITFFSAFMTLNGKREKSNRHWLTCRKVPKEHSAEFSKGYNICCTGGAYDKNTGAEEIQPINFFFKKYYGPFLTNSFTKVFVVLLYAGFLGVSIYGCFQIKEGIDLSNLAPDGSYVADYYHDEKTYFTKYGPNVMVAVKEKFPYWNNTERARLKKTLEKFDNLTFIDSSLFLSWLDYFVTYAGLIGVDISNESDFNANLPLILQSTYFQQDVNLTNGASRFFIQTVNITDAIAEKNMLNALRATAEEESTNNVALLVYHPAFIYYDQYAVVVENTVQNIIIATVAMLVISLLLIPSPICSLWVTFAIASIIVGVAGFMALWDVNLDSISMINLIICIGFSVDFSAHISYAFVSSSKSSANEKAVEALFALGYPIVQGAISTILGVVVLSASSSYIFRTFFKIMFLVITFGMVHGIMFIPVFMTFFGCCNKPGKVNNDGGQQVDPTNEQRNRTIAIYDNMGYKDNGFGEITFPPVSKIGNLSANAHYADDLHKRPMQETFHPDPDCY